MKILALSNNDLDIISTYTQDMVIHPTALSYLKNTRQFVLAGDRFCHEVLQDRKKRLLRQYRRCDALLRVHNVLAVQSLGVIVPKPEEIIETLVLMAIRFEPGAEKPEGFVNLLFDENRQIRIHVECLEVSLADQGNERRTPIRPIHL